MQDLRAYAARARGFSDRRLGGEFGTAAVWFCMGFAFDQMKADTSWPWTLYRVGALFSLFMLLVAWLKERGSGGS